jgi:hypothetical protein
MPWCPKCKTEFTPEDDICPSCGADLVSTITFGGAIRVVDLICGAVIAALTQFAALLTQGLCCGYGSDAALSAIQVGALCLGGICFALFMGRPRLGLSLILWLAAPFLVLVLMGASSIASGGFHPRDLLDWDSICFSVFYGAVSPGIGAVASVIASRWFRGEGHKYGFDLLLFVAAILSTPYAVEWLVRRIYG